jgi:hypothetical protein
VIPPTAIASGPTRATLAVLAGARSIPEVAAACGWTSKGTAHAYLTEARAAGLVTWERGKKHTLRATVTPI